MTRVLAFGTFDGLHPGHLAFLQQASRLGDELVVVVARDVATAQAKGRKPRISERERVRLVAAVRVVNRAVLGDPPSRYGACLKRLNPNVIVVGYDQQWDATAFRKRLVVLGLPNTRVVRLRPHHGHRFHTSKFLK